MIKLPVSKNNILFNRERLDYSEDFLFIKRWKKNSRNGAGTVMEKWEVPLMQKHIDLLNVKDKNVLEVGFGMGISANMIQQAGPKSHTIIESHPDVINYYHERYPHKDTTTLIMGYWQNVILNIGKFDCIFFDTHMDVIEDFFNIVDSKLNVGGKFTFFHWENFHKDYVDYNVERFPFEYEMVFIEGATKKGTCMVPLYTKTETSKFNKDYKIFLPQTQNHILG